MRGGRIRSRQKDTIKNAEKENKGPGAFVHDKAHTAFSQAGGRSEKNANRAGDDEGVRSQFLRLFVQVLNCRVVQVAFLVPVGWGRQRVALRFCDVEAELLRIVQEALANARKHAHAENIWISSRIQPPLFEIKVEDDGQGLGQGRDDSYGLKIMGERAERIGGDLEVGARDTGGTIVRVWRA